MIIIAMAAAVASGCEQRSEPERVLNAYAVAIQERRCGDAMELLSARTRYSLESLRVKPQHQHSPLPIEQYYCNELTFQDCKLGEMSLKNDNSDTVSVSMPCGRTQDSFLPGFPSIFLKYEPRDWELVRENERWHVVLSFVNKIVEIREREDHLREKAIREQEERRRKKDSTNDR